MAMPTGEHCWKKNSGAPWARTSNLRSFWIPSLTHSPPRYLGRYVNWDLNTVLFIAIIFTMVIILPSLNPAKFFQFNSRWIESTVRQLGRITCAIINTSNEVKCPLLWEFWIKNFSRRISERVFVGNIANIRNECLFFWVHWEWIVARDIPMNPDKKTLIP